jgi:hypothetical protein
MKPDLGTYLLDGITSRVGCLICPDKTSRSETGKIGYQMTVTKRYCEAVHRASCTMNLGAIAPVVICGADGQNGNWRPSDPDTSYSRAPNLARSLP